MTFHCADAQIQARRNHLVAQSLREQVEELSERELSVLRLLAGTLTRREIGDVLYLSQNTVKTHVQAI